MKIYPNPKHPSEMTRREKREYKRWLVKNEYWDGYFVDENHKKTSDVFFARVKPKIEI